MAAEIGELRVMVTEEYLPQFIDSFNTVMEKKEKLFDKEEHALKKEDFEDYNRQKYNVETKEFVDFWVKQWEGNIYGRFQNPYKPDLLAVLENFASSNTTACAYIEYGLEWDNSWERRSIDLILEDGMEDDEDDEDEDEEIDKWECERNEYGLKDGKWVVIKTEKYIDTDD